jgi:putative flippase GtrA
MIGQIAAYVVGGGAMTLLHSATYWALAEIAEIEPYVANSLAAIVAGLAGYVLHSNWTFGHGKTANNKATTFGRYAIVSLLCYFLNSFWVWLVVKQWSFSVIASIIPMILITPWLGFALNRLWTFKRSPPHSPEITLPEQTQP